MVTGRANGNRAIGRSRQAVSSGKGRRAILVLRVLNPGESGFRYTSHWADEFVVRECGRRLFKHRGGRGGKKATLAVVHVPCGLQPGAVVGKTGKKQGEYDCAGKREELHGGPITRWFDLSKMDRF